MDDILFWLPGIGWFYYLINGYSPRPINHFNPVKNLELILIQEHFFLVLFKFEPLFYNRHLIGVCSSLGTYVGMV
jgi:hypothetical protein